MNSKKNREFETHLTSCPFLHAPVKWYNGPELLFNFVLNFSGTEKLHTYTHWPSCDRVPDLGVEEKRGHAGAVIAWPL